MTSLPSSRRRSHRCDPINPAPPVTKIRIKMENGKLITENETNVFLHFPFSVIHYPLFQVFFEESQNAAVFVGPTFGPDKAVIFRRIELLLKIVSLAQPDQFFGQ